MFETDLVKEIYIFLFAINQGIILGLLYDTYKAIRKLFKPKKVLGAVEDIVLWIIITLIVFIFLFKHLNGVFRGFVFIGFLIGGLFYLKILSNFTFPVIFKTFKLIFDLINEIIKAILYPFKTILVTMKKKRIKNKRMHSEFKNETKRYLKIFSKKK